MARADLPREIHNVLTTAPATLFTLGADLRGLFRLERGSRACASGSTGPMAWYETRNWFMLRLESVCYVVLGAAADAGPGLSDRAWPAPVPHGAAYAPWLEPLEGTFTFLRFGIATVVLVIALVVAHKWLCPPAAAGWSRSFPASSSRCCCGSWPASPSGRYLAEYSWTYVACYKAASPRAMIALMYLYWTASIFVYGGAAQRGDVATRRRVAPVRDARHRSPIRPDAAFRDARGNMAHMSRTPPMYNPRFKGVWGGGVEHHRVQ